MSKTLILRRSFWSDSGVEVTYVESRGVLQIGGWYDGNYGMEPQEISLGDFLRGLGIDVKTIQKELEARE